MEQKLYDPRNWGSTEKLARLSLPTFMIVGMACAMSIDFKDIAVKLAALIRILIGC